MPGYVISCCSTADLTKEWLEGRDIKFVYFNYQLDGVSCKDDFGVTNPPAQLYAKMLSGQDCKTGGLLHTAVIKTIPPRPSRPELLLSQSVIKREPADLWRPPRVA